ncbi:MAG: hypothetical protein H0U27_02775, partial [Nitrosopumilus sp.]|nr:hypothetical protein [Nitrosopumilus sp.]
MPYNKINSSEPCFICFESLENSIDCVAHDNGGEKHPTHRKCIKAWIEASGDINCPACKIPTKMSNNFSKKEIVSAGVVLSVLVGGGLC